MAILMRRTALALAAVAIGACGFVRDPVAVDVPGSIQVHSVLVAGASTATVLITRLNPEAVSSTVRPRPHPVQDATVRLIRGGDTLRLVAGAGGEACVSQGFFGETDEPLRLAAGCYTALAPEAVESGATYELRVDLPSGDEVHGIAVIPELPRLLTPEPGTRLGEPFKGRWAPIPNRLFEIHLDPDAEECRGLLKENEGPGATTSLTVLDVDSITAWPVVGCDGAVPDPVTADLVLTVYDAPLTHHLSVGSGSIGADNASVGLTGAFGIFAGAAQDRVSVTLPPPAF